LSGENSLGNFETLVRSDETDDIGETGIGSLHRAVEKCDESDELEAFLRE